MTVYYTDKNTLKKRAQGARIRKSVTKSTAGKDLYFADDSIFYRIKDMWRVVKHLNYLRY